MLASIVILQAAPSAPAWMSALPMVLIMAIFWFLIIVPQRRQQKAHKAMVQSLKRGDEVVTVGGLVGEIVGVKDDLINLRTGQVTVVVERERIARRKGGAPAPETK